MMSWRWLAIVGFLAAPAVASGQARDLPRGAYLPLSPEAAAVATAKRPRSGHEPPRRLIYMNRNGGEYTYGPSPDSPRNITPIVITPSGSATVPRCRLTDAEWQQLMVCVRLMYAPFNVEVTDVDPGDVDHIESVVGGRDSDVGWTGAGGVASLMCGGVIERGIAFTFSDVYGHDVQTICEVVAQETAHVMGLEHELLCSDPMTYLPACGPKKFQDQSAPCGEFEARPCQCGGGAQNSYRTLLERLGPAEMIPPTVAITSPQHGAEVTPGFVVSVDASDNYVVSKVQLRIDGTVVASDGTPPYDLVAPISVARGPRTLEVEAYDFAGNIGRDSILVTVVGECEVDTDCPSGEVCADGACQVALGGRCALHDDCASGLCVYGPDDQKVCSQACGGDGSCPSGFTCQKGASGTTPKCFAGGGDGGGCRAAGTGRGAGLVTSALALLGLVALRRRSR